MSVRVESEMPLASTVASDAREIAIDPASVVALLDRLAEKRPPNWLGVVWFRLPTVDDRRAWSLAALRAVIEGRVPRAQMRVRTATTAGGSVDVRIANDGDAARGSHGAMRFISGPA